MKDDMQQAPDERNDADLTELGAASTLTKAIGNRKVEPNLEPLEYA